MHVFVTLLRQSGYDEAYKYTTIC